MKKVEKQAWLYGTAGMLVGVLVAGSVATVTATSQHDTFMKKMDSHMSMHQTASVHNDMSMTDMAEQLKSKSGDDFDKAFIEMMVTHHEGAVAMAELIPSRAKHKEIKDLGEAIISAQTKEISDMQQWQKDWGYTSGEMNQTMHGGH